MNMKTLYCQAGEHEWQRPAQRGRTPLNCPEHTEAKAESSAGGLKGLDKARAVKQSRRVEVEREIADRIEKVINDPRMRVNNPDKYAVDARRTTPDKLRFIQERLTHHRDNLSHSEIADFEKMREKILKDPFTRSGHLL
jgi:hypothetical protein